MRVGLNAGFGDSLAGEFAGLDAHGFTVARQDVYAHHDASRIPALVTEFAGAPVRALFLIGGGSIAHADGVLRIEPHELAALTATVVDTAAAIGLTDYAIEIGNEPDIAHPDYSHRPQDFAEAVRQCQETARSHGFTGSLISGGIANLNDRGFAYLEQMVDAPTFPLTDVVIGFHRYPETGRGPFAPHDDFSSRTEEWDTLMALVRDQPVACTEFGYHTATPERGYVLTDYDVARAVLWDLAFYEARAVPLACVYQLNDGPGEDAIDRYGVRALDGTWKPVAQRIRVVYGDP